MSHSGDRERRPEATSKARLRGDSTERVARPNSVRSVPDDGSNSSRRRPAAGDASRDRTRSRAVSGAEVAAVKRYRVVLERDESGAWVANVPSIPGCHSYGRSLVEARRRVREALALWVNGAESAELADDVRLPSEAIAAVRRSRGARKKLTRARDVAGSATADAARQLVEAGLGVRDAAYLLDLSHQRVQQLLRSL